MPILEDIERKFQSVERQIAEEIVGTLSTEEPQLQSHDNNHVLDAELALMKIDPIADLILSRRLSLHLSWLNQNHEIRFPREVIETYLYHYLFSRGTSPGRPTNKDFPPPLDKYDSNNRNQFMKDLAIVIHDKFDNFNMVEKMHAVTYLCDTIDGFGSLDETNPHATLGNTEEFKTLRSKIIAYLKTITFEDISAVAQLLTASESMDSKKAITQAMKYFSNISGYASLTLFKYLGRLPSINLYEPLSLEACLIWFNQYKQQIDKE